MDDGVKLALLGLWMALFVIFAGRKFTQPIKVIYLNRYWSWFFFWLLEFIVTEQFFYKNLKMAFLMIFIYFQG